MIEAQPSAFHRWLVTAYFRRKARRRFAAVLERGLPHLADWNNGGPARTPLILLANHSSWWDAAMPFLVSFGACRHDAYAIMEHRQLDRFRFFARAGAFSIVREHPRQALHTLRYGAELLRGSSRVLWIYPQGVIVPNDAGPIVGYPGAAHLVQMVGGCMVAAVAFRYQLLRHELPVAYVSIGQPQPMAAAQGRDGIRATHAQMMELLTNEVESLRAAVVSESTEGFRELLRGKRSVDEWWSGVKG